MLFFYIFVQTNDRILIRVIYPDPITGFFWIRNRPTIGSIALEVKILCDKKTSSIADLI